MTSTQQLQMNRIQQLRVQQQAAGLVNNVLPAANLGQLTPQMQQMYVNQSRQASLPSQTSSDIPSSNQTSFPSNNSGKGL